MTDTAASFAPVLTIEDFQKIIDAPYPPLYYSLSENVERRMAIYCKENDISPEYVVCHPGDFDALKNVITNRTLVNIKDEPRNRRIDRIKKFFGFPKKIGDLVMPDDSNHAPPQGAGERNEQ